MSSDKIMTSDTGRKDDNKKGGKSYGKDNNNSKKKGYSKNSKKDNNNPIKVPQDWTWYANSDSELRNFASFPFADVLGGNLKVANKATRVPGILRLPFIPVIGGFRSDLGPRNIDQNPIQRAAEAYYDYMFEGFTSTADFEPADLMMTAIACSNVCVALAELKRVYGVMKWANPRNLFLARALVASLGFDYDDVLKNKANLRASIDTLVESVNKIMVLPKGFSLADRWMSLVSNVFFTDVNAPLAQMVVCTPSRYMVWTDSLTPDQGTALQYISNDSTKTVDQAISTINDMVNRFEREDVRRIFAALGRVYENKSDLVQLTTLPEDFECQPAYSDVWLSEFHNMTQVNLNNFATLEKVTPTDDNPNDYVQSSTLAVGQYNGKIYSIPGIYLNSTEGAAMQAFLQGNKVIDILHPANSPEFVIDATAMVLGAGDIVEFDDTPNFLPIVARTEIFGNSLLYSFDMTTGLLRFDSAIQVMTNSSPYEFLDANTTSFNYAPLRYWVTMAGPEEIESIRILGELYNYTSIANNAVTELNSRCMFRMLAIPTYTKSITK